MIFDHAISHILMAKTIKHKMPSYPIQFKDTNLSYPKSCRYFAKISAWKTFDKPMLLWDAEKHQRKGAECSNS